jgi:hypothetical protein
MKFNPHYNLAGSHAVLGASNYHWVNYSPDKLVNTYNNLLNKQRGTKLHELAANLISMRVKLPKTKQTLNMHVNDAIGFKMDPEVVLYYSDNCFGTTDAISFKDNLLRIHDLKTGFSETNILQLKIYAALFCLEYQYEPKDIQMILRIYKLDDIQECIPDPNEIKYIMNKIIEFDKLIESVKRGGEL